MIESSEQGRAVGSLIFEALRLAGRLTLAGDAMMAEIGLTSARWQILGIVAYLPSPRTVSQIARTMGQSRQAVQRIVNDLEQAGVLAFRDNPAHKRAPLIAITDKGRDLFAEAEARRVPWTEGLGTDLDGHDVKAALATLAALRKTLERRDERG